MQRENETFHEKTRWGLRSSYVFPDQPKKTKELGICRGRGLKRLERVGCLNLLIGCNSFIVLVPLHNKSARKGWEECINYRVKWARNQREESTAVQTSPNLGFLTKYGRASGALTTAQHFLTSAIQRHILSHCVHSWTVPSQKQSPQTLGIKVSLKKQHRDPPR